MIHNHILIPSLKEETLDSARKHSKSVMVQHSQRSNRNVHRNQITYDEQQLVDSVLNNDRQGLKTYILNILANLRQIKQQNKRLKLENMLNLEIEKSYKEEQKQSIKEFKNKIKLLEERHQQLKERIKDFE